MKCQETYVGALHEKEVLSNDVQEFIPDQTLLNTVTLKLDELSSNFKASVRSRITRKVNKFYKGTSIY